MKLCFADRSHLIASLTRLGSRLLTAALFCAVALSATAARAQSPTTSTLLRTPPPTPHDWALATNDALAFAWESHALDVLGWDTPTLANIDRWRTYLKDYWGITDRPTLIDAYDSLRASGMRVSFQKEGERLTSMTTEQILAEINEASSDAQKFHILTVLHNYPRLGKQGLVAWDDVRAIQIVGRAKFVGYISEDDAWNLIMPVARDLQKEFDSWEAMGESYMAGREYWSYNEIQKTGDKYRTIQRVMLEDPNSPYNLIPWDLDLGTD